MNWTAVNWIRPMMRKSGIVTARGIKFYNYHKLLRSQSSNLFELVLSTR